MWRGGTFHFHLAAPITCTSQAGIGRTRATYRNLMLTTLLGGCGTARVENGVIWGDTTAIAERAKGGRSQGRKGGTWRVPARVVATSPAWTIGWVFFVRATAGREPTSGDDLDPRPRKSCEQRWQLGA